MSAEITKAELQQLANYNQKKAFLRAEIEHLTSVIDNCSVTDTVSGSDNNDPYIKHAIVIRGSNAPDATKKQLQAKRSQLKFLERKATSAYLSVLDKLQRIPDPIVQRSLMLHYRDGLTWTQAADRIGGNNTADSLRMLCKRYLSGVKQKK